jgi:hypothetical protein
MELGLFVHLFLHLNSSSGVKPQEAPDEKLERNGAIAILDEKRRRRGKVGMEPAPANAFYLLGS